jgi:RimJ/RimL family protein N-acetyltransferase
LSVRAERLSGARETDVLAFLARSPYENVFLTYLILFDSAPATRNAIRVAIDESGNVVGVAYFGRQVAIAGSERVALEAFAEIARAHHGERMILGPRESTMYFWSLIEPYHIPARVIRERQYVMKLDRAGLRDYEHSVVARRARIDEWTSVADNSALMIAQELEYDPLRSSPEFTSNVRAMIDRGLWWVAESIGRLCFYCNVGPWSPNTAQLQGIWTPPEMRGKGLATASLAAISDRLLSMTPTLSLYVNDFNEPAIALYERVGFETVGEFATLLF